MARVLFLLRRLALHIGVAALLAAPEAARAAEPPNASCAAAAVIPAAGPFPYAIAPLDTTGPSDDSTDPDLPCNTRGPGSASHSVWYTFTPEATDTYQIDTIGTESTGQTAYDPIIGVFTGSCDSLTALTGACGDNTPGSFDASILVRLSAGTKYTILVAGLGARDFKGTLIPSTGGTLHLKISRVAVSYPYQYVIPSVAHAQGATLYISDLNVTNVDMAAGVYTIQFLGHAPFGLTGLPPASQPNTTPSTIPYDPSGAGGSALWPDILASPALGLDAASNPYGALLISSSVRLLTGARTYSPSTTGTGSYGQYVVGMDAAGPQILSNGESGTFVGIRENSNTRTNIAMFNLSQQACAVWLELFDSAGAPWAGGNGYKQGRILPPFTTTQKAGMLSLFNTSNAIENGSIRVTNATPDCRIGAVAYVIDGNEIAGTNDPYAIPLQK